MPRHPRRWVTGVAVAAALAFGGFAVASAALSAVPDDLGAGGEPVASCDTAFVIDGFTLNGSQQITAISVSGIDAACIGGQLTVDLTRADDVSIGTGGPVTVTTSTLTVPIPDTPAASLVKHEVIIIVGP